MLGVDEKISERILKHFQGEIVEIYDLWKYVPQKRAALEKLGAYYWSLLSREAPFTNPQELIRQWHRARRKKNSRAVRGQPPRVRLADSRATTARTEPVAMQTTLSQPAPTFTNGDIPTGNDCISVGSLELRAAGVPQQP